MNKLRLLVADDHPLFLDGLLSLLRAESGLAEIHSAADGNEVIAFLEKKAVDICVLDINMPGKDGISTAKEIRSRWPAVRIIMLTTYSDKAFIAALLSIGVSGYVLKNSTRSELIRAIHEVSQGRTWFSEGVTDAILDNATALKKSEASGKVILTAREIEIVKLLAKEYTNDRIAEELHISFRTVETHRKNIMQKTGARNLAGLLKFAYEQGLVS